MKIQTRYFIGLFSIIVVISNLYSTFNPTTFIIHHYDFESTSGNFHFTTYPSKGRDIEMMERQYSDFVERKGFRSEEL